MQSIKLETQTLNARHYREWVNGRGLSPDWVLVNCKSITAKEASEELGYRVESEGVLLESDVKAKCYQVQFRPDKPMAGSNGKTRKYLTPRTDIDVFDAMLPINPHDESYWRDTEKLKGHCYQIDGHPHIILTEGVAKAIAGCSHGVPTISLLGVWQGLMSKEVKRQKPLVPTLQRLADEGFGFVIVFDADAHHKKGVRQAQKALVREIQRQGCPVHVATGLWPEQEGKGMDDFIQNHGFERFRDEALAKAMKIERWEKQFAPLDEFEDKSPAADIVAVEIAKEFEGNFLFNGETNEWMHYGVEAAGVWTRESTELFHSHIRKWLDGRGIRGYGSDSYIVNIAKALQHILIVRHWEERPSNELLPFSNGVLNLATGKLLKHSPEFRLTWSLPRPYESVTKSFSRISEFLDFVSEGSRHKRRLLECVLNAALKGRAELQKYVLLQGGGGTGKGTFLRLARDLVGERNVWESNLVRLETNRFELANVAGKRLLILPDQDTRSREFGNFKSLTGGDPVIAEHKGKQPVNFIFQGLVMVAANQPPFSGMSASALTRREIAIPFTRKPKGKVNPHLNREFHPELTAFTRHLLSIPDSEVDAMLLGGDLPEAKALTWENLALTDSVADFIDSCLYHSPGVETRMGGKKHTDERATTIYAAYTRFCEETNRQPLSTAKFSPRMFEVASEWIGGEISKAKRRYGHVAVGIAIRTGAVSEPPTITEQLEQKIQECAGLGAGLCRVDAGLGAGLEPLQNGKCAGFAGFTPIPGQNESPPPNKPGINENDIEGTCDTRAHMKEETPSNPANPAHLAQGAGFDPAQTLHKPCTNPAQTLHFESEVEKDDYLTHREKNCLDRVKVALIHRPTGRKATLGKPHTLSGKHCAQFNNEWNPTVIDDLSEWDVLTPG